MYLRCGEIVSNHCCRFTEQILKIDQYDKHLITSYTVVKVDVCVFVSFVIKK